MAVFLRLLRDEEGKQLFTFQELSVLLDNGNPRIRGDQASIGSLVIPRTTNAIERFFRAFNRFYKMRCGFFTVVSARRELIFFPLMYVFIQQPGSGKAPIESIMPEAKTMPLYRFINDPLGSVMGVEDVKRNVKMADSQLLQSIAA